jgi:hypothetical protein
MVPTKRMLKDSVQSSFPSSPSPPRLERPDIAKEFIDELGKADNWNYRSRVSGLASLIRISQL